jgi:septal ring factor EnvC (AmiA/AmiB activator)
MCGINNMSRARADGTLADGHRRLICTSANKEQSCTVGGSVTVVPVEKALLSYCSDVMNIAGLLGGSQDDSGLKNEQVKAEAEHAELHRKVEKLTDALLEFEDSPRAVLERIREYEARQSALKKRIESIRHELVALSNSKRPGLIEEWETVKSGVNGLDYDARIRVRQLVSQTFERIDVYIKGIHAAGEDDSIHARVARELLAGAAQIGGRDPIDVVLRFAGGVTRLLRINRKTGEWLAMADYQLNS